ncbi:MAG: Uncharacterized protein LiPW30_338 [Parcubacteria group bacterium LiPW_30]|nr:MAG: Uncharacterized protein LiPW30_338 [Parcubacteria group bacterium LiPW_30]
MIKKILSIDVGGIVIQKCRDWLINHTFVLYKKEDLHLLFLVGLLAISVALTHFQVAFLALVPTVVLILSGCYGVWLYKRRNDPNLLTYKIKEERKRLCPGYQQNIVPISFRELYFPSPASLLGLFVIGFVINVPAFIPFFNNIISFDQSGVSGVFQNLIAVHAGIGTIIFALLIFVAESLRDDTKERASVLLKESLLFPLAVLEIITFLCLIWFDKQNFLAFISITVVGIFAIYSLYALIKILLSPFELRKKRLELLKDRIKRSINEAINERVGNNYLLKSLEQGDIALNYSYLGRKEEKDYVLFRINDNGIVGDIDLSILRKIGEKLERQSNAKGLSFYENKPKSRKDPTLSSPEDTPSDSGPTKKDDFFVQIKKWDLAVTKQFHQRVDSESNVVLCVRKNLLEDNLGLIDELTGLVQKAFHIEKEDNFSEELRLELDALRDQFIHAITVKKLTDIDDFRKTYIALTESFLELMYQCGGGYDPEQAKKEANAMFGGWTEIQWLDEHIRDAFMAVFATADKELIHKVSYIPISIAILGVKKNDHFIFQKFIKYARAFHYHALEISDPKLQKNTYEDGITWLKELTDFYISPDLELEPKKIEFAFQVLLELQAILKTAYDKNHKESFNQALGVIQVLLKNFKPAEEYPNAEHLQWELQRANSDQKKALEEKLNNQKILEKAEMDFKNKRNQLIFGLAAWIFKRIRIGTDQDKSADYLDGLKVLLPKTIPELTELFVITHDHDIQNWFGWNWWDLIPDGEVHHIDFGSELEWLYLDLVFQTITSVPDADLQVIKLSPSRDLAFLAENNSSLMQKINQIETSAFFRGHLPTGYETKIPILKGLLESAKSDQEKIENDRVRNAVIHPTKLEEFYKLFIREFDENASMRGICKDLGIFLDESKGDDIKAEIDLFGYNQIDLKEGFLEKWHVHYVGWGEQYGEGFGRSEDLHIYERFYEQLTKELKTDAVSLIPDIENLIKEYGFAKPFLFGPFADSFEMQNLRHSEKFIPQWQLGREKKDYEKYPFYLGYLKFDTLEVPVFRIPERGSKKFDKTLCLVDIENIGILKQYPPIKKVEDKSLQRGVFLFNVIDLNVDEERRKKLVEANPDWLKDKTDPENYLRQRVVINIFEKVDFEVKNKDAGIRIVINPQADNTTNV